MSCSAGWELFLLSIDEGISGYRDDSLATVQENEIEVSVNALLAGMNAPQSYVQLMSAGTVAPVDFQTHRQTAVSTNGCPQT